MKDSVVLKSDLNSEFRIDSEYYSIENLASEDIVKKSNYKLLGKICKLLSGPFGSTVTTDKYDFSSNYRYIRGKDVESFFIKNDDPIYIEKPLFNDLATFHLKENDILVTVVGKKFGKVAIITDDEIPSIFSCKSSLIRDPDINIFYLATFLQCQYGYRLVRRGQRGVAQPGINLYDLQNIPVPFMSREFQKKIELTYKEAKSLIQESKNIFEGSKHLLLSELGLLNWKPKQQLSFVRNISDTISSERIDAEYFQPKYVESVNVIKNYKGGWNTLENMCKLIGHPSNPPYAKHNSEDKVYIVSQKHLGEYFLNDSYWLDKDAKYTTTEFINKNNQFILKKNDLVIYTVGGPPHLGKANIIFSEDVKATIGSFITLVRANDINPFYLLVFLNSSVGKLLTNRYQRGMVQQYLYPKDLSQTPIPIISGNIQQQIQEIITGSYNLQKQSKHLLECAKRSVEIAIEQDETIAMKWLQEQTKDGGFNASRF